MRARQESDEGDREGGRAAKAAEGRRALTLGSDGSVIQVGARTSMSSFSFVSLLSLSLCISKTEWIRSLSPLYPFEVSR